MSLKVYGQLDSGNCYKVRLLLRLLGQAYEWVDVDVFGGETHTSEFLRINPNARVPVLQFGDQNSPRFLPESNAILYYLAARSGRYWPATERATGVDGASSRDAVALDQARVLEWMFFEQYTHEPAVAVARSIRLRGQAESQAERLGACIAAGYRALNVMEQHLEHHDYFAAGRYTIADLALYAYTHVAEQGGFSLDGYPALRAWLARIEREPGHISIEEI
jgi:glutathione S-transferase